MSEKQMYDFETSQVLLDDGHYRNLTEDGKQIVSYCFYSECNYNKSCRDIWHACKQRENCYKQSDLVSAAMMIQRILSYDKSAGKNISVSQRKLFESVSNYLNMYDTKTDQAVVLERILADFGVHFTYSEQSAMRLAIAAIKKLRETYDLEEFLKG